VTLRNKLAACTLGAALLMPVATATQAAAGAPQHHNAATQAIGDDPIAVVAQRAVESFGTDGFAPTRDAVAAAVADRLGADAAAMRAAWASADEAHQLALMNALAQMGVPYRRNAQRPGEGFDCSGLTGHAWAQAGVTLPRVSRDQIRGSAKVTRDTAQAGDLVFYPGHVMMWLGVDNYIVHSPFTGRDVEVSTISKRKLNRLSWANPIG
jgi:peptidoglycan DL-endopeptidase CwlO